MNAYKVINNKRLSQFEIVFDNSEKATLDYRWLKGSMVLMRTLVPKEGRQKGAGSTLAKAALDHAASHHLKIIIYCGFVEQYVNRYKEYAVLVTGNDE
jgi:predicted GNAT family acetyltransferase